MRIIIWLSYSIINATYILRLKTWDYRIDIRSYIKLYDELIPLARNVFMCYNSSLSCLVENSSDKGFHPWNHNFQIFACLYDFLEFSRHQNTSVSRTSRLLALKSHNETLLINLLKLYCFILATWTWQSA